MSPLAALAARWRFTLAAALVLALGGALAVGLMPREEDPTLADRFGLVVAPYPGADVARVERLVVRPLEDALAEVKPVRDVVVAARAGVAVARVRLRDDTADLATAWSEVQDALALAHRDMPPEALLPQLEHDLLATEAMLFSVTGLPDRLELVEAAWALRRRLARLPEVARVRLAGDPAAQVAVQVDDAALRAVGLPRGAVAAALAGRNSTRPGGSLPLDGRQVPVRPASDLVDLDDVAATPLAVPGGGVVRLDALAQVRREQATPPEELARVDGTAAVLVGVVPRRGQDALRFGAAVSAAVAAHAAAHPSLRITPIASQPVKVDGRLRELGGALALGVLVVALVVTLAMGLRLGLVVAAIVPLVAAATVAVYALAGGVLHQMAVAALVIALGLLVDNAIVMAEAIQRGLDAGLERRAAALAAVLELKGPLAIATGTTLAAFLPMALATGPTAEFTAAIPQVVGLALVLSYLFALVITPALAVFGLRPTRRRGAGAGRGRLAGALVRHPRWALVASLLALVGAGSFARHARIDFFPASDREQIVVTLEAPEGAELAATDALAARLEAWLLAEPTVRSVAAVTGRAAPFFYYNLPREPRAPHLAAFIVTAAGAAEARALVDRVMAQANAVVPEAIVVARRLEQGPPVAAPVEIRLTGEDLGHLRAAADAVRATLAAAPGALAVRDTQGGGVPTLVFDLRDAPAARAGVSRAALAAGLLGQTQGLVVGQHRAGRVPEPIVLRTVAGRDTPASDLLAVDLAGGSAADPRPIPLAAVASARVELQPAVIHRRDGQRTVSVLAEVAATHTHEQVLRAARPALEAQAWPAGVTWAIGGAAESSAEANAALGSKGPFGALALVALLLWQFNSFRRVGIVLLAGPLAVLGIWPGLVLAGEPFGFMALLGAIALIGIVVNGAIVLIDRADRARDAGASVEAALVDALQARTRPILLTTATTVAGLAPLLFSDSTLWPALAAAMISGLTIGTLLTLVVTPALYRMWIRDPAPGGPAALGSSAEASAGAALSAQPGLVALAGLWLAVGTLAVGPRAAWARAPVAEPAIVAATGADPSPADGTAAAPPALDLAAALGAAPDGLTPAEVAARAEALAPGAEVGRARARAARAGQDEVAAARLPNLTLSARYTRLSPQTNDPLVPGAPAEQLAAARALAGQVVDPAARALLAAGLDTQARLGGARVPVLVDQVALSATALYPVTTALLQLAPRHARLGLEARAAEAQARATARQAGLRALLALYGAMEARALVTLADERTAWARAHAAELADRFQLGAATAADLEAAHARLAEIHLGRAAAVAAEASARAALAALTGVAPEVAWAAPTLPDPVGDVPEAGPPQVAAAVAEARRARPEARALQALLRAASSEAEAERAAQLPELVLVAHLDAANPNPRYVPARPQFDATWDVGAVLRWSPDAFVAARARVARAAARRAEVQAERAAFEQGLWAEVADATYGRAAALERLQAAARLEGAADATLRQRSLLAGEGQARASEVLAAEAERAAARALRVQAALAACGAEARLRWATGAPLVAGAPIDAAGPEALHPEP